MLCPFARRNVHRRTRSAREAKPAERPAEKSFPAGARSRCPWRLRRWGLWRAGGRAHAGADSSAHRGCYNDARRCRCRMRRRASGPAARWGRDSRWRRLHRPWRRLQRCRSVPLASGPVARRLSTPCWRQDHHPTEVFVGASANSSGRVARWASRSHGRLYHRSQRSLRRSSRSPHRNKRGGHCSGNGALTPKVNSSFAT